MTSHACQLDLVQNYFADDGAACSECAQRIRSREPHGEITYACNAIACNAPSACPVLDDLIEKARTLTDPEE